MSKKPIDKDKLFFWTLLSCMIAIVVMMIVLFATQDIWGPRYRAEFYGEEWPPVTYTPVPTKSVEPTNAPEPPEETPKVTETTTAPAATDAPDAEPTKALEETVTPTEPAEPTDKPVETVTPDATAVPEEAVTPTVALTAIPTATSAPMPSATPSPIVESGKEPTYRVQMGDNVWYEFYMDENVLIVTGTGATWDFKDFDTYVKPLREKTGVERSREDLLYRVDIIVIEEGVSRIGDYALGYMTSVKKVVLASTLEEVGERGFLYVGNASMMTHNVETEWTGLDLDKLECETTSFWLANLPADVDGSKVQCTPTPTPIVTLTPTPIPDPNNPRLLHTEPMGENIVYEFYDNGYVYVKGTGKIKDNPAVYLWRNIPEGVLDLVEYYVFEEGVTELGYNCLAGYALEFWFPTTMSRLDDFNAGQIVHWYYEGKPITIKFGDYTYAKDLHACLNGEKSAEEYKIEIIWE